MLIVVATRRRAILRARVAARKRGETSVEAGAIDPEEAERIARRRGTAATTRSGNVMTYTMPRRAMAEIEPMRAEPAEDHGERRLRPRVSGYARDAWIPSCANTSAPCAPQRPGRRTDSHREQIAPTGSASARPAPHAPFRRQRSRRGCQMRRLADDLCAAIREKGLRVPLGQARLRRGVAGADRQQADGQLPS